MSSNKKKYIITSITLGAIAAVSAGLIGLTNLITKDAIATNEKNKTLQGIVSIFGSSAKIKSESDIANSQFAGNYKYVNYVYTVSDNEDATIGYAFRTTGSNSYGKISLLAGFTTTNQFKNIYLIVDEQTYASTLEDEYVAKITDGNYENVDVHCGATYGAELVRAMIEEAKSAMESN